VLAIRIAIVDDLEALLSLWRELESVQRGYRFYPPAADGESRIAAAFRAAIAEDDGDILLASEDGEPIGMALVRLDHPSRSSDETAVEVMRVVVRSDQRGTGAGRALVETAEAWARDRGIRTLVAAIFMENEPSRAFWRRVGFRPWVERMIREVPPG